MPSSPVLNALPSLSTILQSYILTLQHIPKGVRDCWAKALHGCLTDIVRKPADVGLWTRLFILPKCVLASLAVGHRLPWREILQRVRGRLRKWFDEPLSTVTRQEALNALTPGCRSQGRL